MGFKLGLEGKLYRNTGSFGSPVWDEIPNVDDLSMPDEFDEADMTNRASGGIEMVMPSIRKIGCEFGMNYDPADADITAMRTAYAARTLLEFAIADGTIATAGTQYMRAYMYILKFPWDQKLKEGMKIPVSLKPGFNASGNPSWNTAS